MSSPTNASANTHPNDMQALGLFSQPSYISIGDTFEKRAATVGKEEKKDYARHQGKQFTTSPPKRGKVGTKVFFDEFKPLYQTEKFEDPGTSQKEYGKEQKKKNIVPRPFAPSSPSKKNSGLGAYYGTIGTKFEHQVEYEVQKKEDKPKPVEHEKRNFVTSPSKRGTYGVPHSTIGPSFEYKSDPYDFQRETDLKENADKLKKRIGAPFKGTSHPLDFFDTHKNVAASTIYATDEKALSPKKEKPSEDKKVEKPFKPSSPPKRGFNSTFTPFPEYKTDPFEQKPETKDKDEKSRPVFKPVSNAKSTPTRSIVFNNTL
jgi:hypothetical protein